MCARPSPDIGLSPGRAAELRLAELERDRRRLEAEIIELLGDVERSGTYAEDGHLNVRSWALGITSWSPGEATARVRTARAVAGLPAVKQSLTDGTVGVAQAHAFGRAHANLRVRDQLPDSEAVLLQSAQALPFDDFTVVMKRWLDLADSDGAKQRHEDAHTQRSASIVDVGEETVVRATCGAARGEIMRAIFDAFCDAEFAVDRDLAGPGGILARTDSQRRADALLAIFEAAARGGHGGKLEIVVNYVVDRETFERELRAGLGAKVDRLDPVTLERRRCETLRGTQIQPADAVAAALIGTVRRVVLGAGSVVIDLGRQRRFTGSARHALLLRDRHCVYAGCTVPAHHAEGDHVLEHGRGGLTNPRNGSLQCPRHNRFKNHGYRTVRDEHGHWHTYRPDGSEVGRPLTTV